MMNEKQRILDMVEQGKLTAKEAMDLLEALDGTEESTNGVADSNVIIKKQIKYKTLKVLVYSEKDGTNVNVNIPLSLIRVVGVVAKDFSRMIPEDARREMNMHGVDLSQIDFDAIFHSLEDGTLDNPDIVNVDINNSEEGVVKVKVFLDER